MSETHENGTHPHIGRKIGQYTITSFIANGGMADVYRAIDKGLDRPVALKLLFPQYSRDKEFTERFQREARSAAKLRHPNIVQVYATGTTAEGDQYIAMEFVEGGTLEGKLSALSKAGKLIEPSIVLNLMVQMADALRTAHDIGIVHRDLKPSNILLRDNNSPVLTDLGIAISGGDARLTQTNKMMGTPDYMSPEQGRGGELDYRSDIYSFGVMLYELLCGRRPFAGDSPWLIVHKQINEQPKPLEDIRPGLSPLVYQIVERCMEKDPAARYQSTQDLVQAMAQAAAENGAVNKHVTTSLHTISLATAGVNPPSGPLSMTANTTGNPLTTPPPITGQPITGSPITGSPVTGPHTGQVGLRWGLIAFLGGTAAVIGGLIIYLLIVPPAEPIRITAEPPAVIAQVTDTATPNPTETASATPLPTSTRDASTVTPIVVVVTATPLPTDTPSRTPRPSATPSATSTGAPTATATSRPTRTPATSSGRTSNASTLGTGNGLPIRFEGDATWGIGQQKNGSFQNTTERSHSGAASGRLDYTFLTDKNDYVVFLQVNPMSGNPNTVSAWVYGDGSGHFVNAWILDANQQVWQVPLGQVFHTGWLQMSGAILEKQAWPWSHISGPDNGKVDYPIQFYALVLDDFNAAYEGEGTIFVDDIAASVQDISAVPTIEPVEPTATP